MITILLRPSTVNKSEIYLVNARFPRKRRLIELGSISGVHSSDRLFRKFHGYPRDATIRCNCRLRKAGKASVDALSPKPPNLPPRADNAFVGHGRGPTRLSTLQQRSITAPPSPTPVLSLGRTPRQHAVDQQVCRWLTGRLDRQHSSERIATHELIAVRLGVRRESVTAAAATLQAAV